MESLGAGCHFGCVALVVVGVAGVGVAMRGVRLDSHGGPSHLVSSGSFEES